MADSITGRRLRGPSPAKAKKMLQDNSANGRPLTRPQKHFFGAIIGRSRRQGGQMRQAARTAARRAIKKRIKRRRG